MPSPTTSTRAPWSSGSSPPYRRRNRSGATATTAAAAPSSSSRMANRPDPRVAMTISQLAPERALRGLELTVVRRLEGFLHGEPLGLLPGPGTELAEAREYQVGDDVRRM